MYITISGLVFNVCGVEHSTTSYIDNGGGRYIEFPYCLPDDTACNDLTIQLLTSLVSKILNI